MGEWFPYLKKRQLVFISGLQGERPTHNAPECIEEYPYSEEGETDATGVDEKCGVGSLRLVMAQGRQYQGKIGHEGGENVGGGIADAEGAEGGLRADIERLEEGEEAGGEQLPLQLRGHDEQVDEGGEEDDAAEELLLITGDQMYIKHDGSLDEGFDSGIYRTAY